MTSGVHNQMAQGWLRSLPCVLFCPVSGARQCTCATDWPTVCSAAHMPVGLCRLRRNPGACGLC